MKHLNFILTGLFFLCGLCCRAQVLPLEENVVLNTKEGQIKGKMLLPLGGKKLFVSTVEADKSKSSTKLYWGEKRATASLIALLRTN